MWKLNKKGFLLAETLVVVGIATAILVVFYEQISNSYHTYQKNAYYDSIQAIHAANNIKKIIIEDGVANFVSALGSNDIIDITNHTYTDAAYVSSLIATSNIKNIYFSKYNLNDVLSDISAFPFDALFIDYLKTLSISSTIGANSFYRIIIILNDNSYSSIKVLYDITAPLVDFNPIGSTPYISGTNVRVTVADDGAGVNTSSLKYKWTTSTTAPTEGSFSTTFTNGDTISTPGGLTGAYYLWILAKDASNNTIITKSNVFDLDNTIPVITMLGTSPVSVTRGTTYTDAGATASDNINGNITANISNTSTVNTGTVGSYTVTYNVNDSCGNSAIPVVRNVNVIP